MRRLKDEWQRAKDKTQGVSIKKFRRLAYYLFFLVLFLAFFDRAMIVASDGIFFGSSQNFGDLPFHLGAIFGFTDGNNFPPQNPSYAGAKFTYPFTADFLTACLIKLGVSVQSAMFVQNVTWAFSLLLVFERFIWKLTKKRFASKIAPFILFFSGGLGFLWFFKDYWYGTQSFWEIIWNLPRDYTIGDKFRWGNTMIVLFITQRSFLLGMPLTIIVLGYLWRIFSRKEHESGKKTFRMNRYSAFFVGLLAGTLPLVHAHSLFVLFIVSAFLFFFSLNRWRDWIAFGIGVSLVALPELFWIFSGSATSTKEFVAWHFGWDTRNDNLLWFWFKNTGILIPCIIAGLFLMIFIDRRKSEGDSEAVEGNDSIQFSALTVFIVPFGFIFVLSNIAKFAPWEWDNIKILIYWFVGSIPLVALAIWWLWSKKALFYRLLAVGLISLLTLSGALDVWRVASAQMRYQLFSKDAVEIAEEIKKKIEPNALFLHAPTFNTPIVLSGRRSMMRYGGHLASHGIDFHEREDDLKRIFSGTATSEIFLKKHGIDYVLISPKVRELPDLNEEFFNRYEIIAEVGEYKVYRVK